MNVSQGISRLWEYALGVEEVPGLLGVLFGSPLGEVGPSAPTPPPNRRRPPPQTTILSVPHEQSQPPAGGVTNLPTIS